MSAATIDRYGTGPRPDPLHGLSVTKPVAVFLPSSITIRCAGDGGQARAGVLRG